MGSLHAKRGHQKETPKKKNSIGGTSARSPRTQAPQQRASPWGKELCQHGGTEEGNQNQREKTRKRTKRPFPIAPAVSRDAVNSRPTVRRLLAFGSERLEKAIERERVLSHYSCLFQWFNSSHSMRSAVCFQAKSISCWILHIASEGPTRTIATRSRNASVVLQPCMSVTPAFPHSTCGQPRCCKFKTYSVESTRLWLWTSWEGNRERERECYHITAACFNDSIQVIQCEVQCVSKQRQFHAEYCTLLLKDQHEP